MNYINFGSIMWSMNKDSSFKSGKDRIMKTKSSNNTLYVITAIASVVVILLAAVGFTNVEAQKVARIGRLEFHKPRGIGRRACRLDGR